jgi:hypothetical protein
MILAALRCTVLQQQYVRLMKNGVLPTTCGGIIGAVVNISKD